MTSQTVMFDDTDELPPGTRLLNGKLVVDVRIGRGGAATVYVATTADGRRLALKIMSAEHALVPNSRDRFRNEVTFAQHLADHPRVVTPYETGEVPELGGRPYLTMPFIKGQPLHLLIGQLSVYEAVTLLRDIARILADVHDRGIIHRDIKPGNVLVTGDEGARVPYLIDFGVAFSRASNVPVTPDLTTAHELPGTKHYMAPEQVMGASPTPGFDVYALGVTAVEVLTGVLPLDDLSPADAARRKCDATAPSLSLVGRSSHLPPGLERVVDAALQRVPERRLPTALRFAEALTGVMAEMEKAQVHAPTGGAGRNPKVLAFAAVAVVLIVFLGVGVAKLASWPGGNARADDREPSMHSMTVSDATTHEAAATLQPAEFGGTTEIGPAPAETSSTTDDSEGGSTDEAPVAEPQPTEPKPPRPPKKHVKSPLPDCADVVADAGAARRARRWSVVLSLTKSSRCWPAKGERDVLRVEALSELRRYTECVALGDSSHNPEVRRMAKNCAVQLNEEKSP